MRVKERRDPATSFRDGTGFTDREVAAIVVIPIAVALHDDLPNGIKLTDMCFAL
jgi:hypothetical protein